MKLSTIKKNFIYNVIYQLLLVILPLISVPYVSRVMGAEAMGEYSYTYSIVTYFMLISMLGINNYGNKRISYLKDNRKEVSKEFWEIYSLQIVMTLLMVIGYIIYLIFICKSYHVLSTLLLIALISCMFDINWLFFGLEKFKLTVTRNIIIKILSVCMVFLLIKSPKDVWLYTIIMSTSTLISQLLLLPFLRKEVEFIFPTYNGILSHLKECIILFIPVIAYSIYKIMDKTMLGIIKAALDLGYYEYAEKIYNIPSGLITALGTVMLPRISNMISRNESKEVESLINKSFEFVFFISIPITFGLSAIASNLAVVFLGNSYEETGKLLSILSFCILFIAIANVIRTQILIPNSKNKEYVSATIIGSIINLVLNIYLIPVLGAIGACIGTVSAEFIVMIVEMFFVRKTYITTENIIKFIRFLVKGIIMYICVIMINVLDCSAFVKLTTQIAVGVLVYCGINIKYIFFLLGIGRKS